MDEVRWREIEIKRNREHERERERKKEKRKSDRNRRAEDRLRKERKIKGVFFIRNLGWD